MIQESLSFTSKEKNFLISYCKGNPNSIEDVYNILKEERGIFETIKDGYNKKYNALQKRYIAELDIFEKKRYKNSLDAVQKKIKDMEMEEENLGGEEKISIAIF